MKQKQERRVHLWYKAAVVHFKAFLGLRSGVVPKPSESSDMTVPMKENISWVVRYRMILFKEQMQYKYEILLLL